MNIRTIDLSNAVHVTDLAAYAADLSTRECALVALQAARAVSDALPEIAQTFLATLETQTRDGVALTDEQERAFNRRVWPACTAADLASEADAFEAAFEACRALRSEIELGESQMATNGARRSAEGAIVQAARVAALSWRSRHGGEFADLARWAHVQIAPAVAHWIAAAR